MVHTFRILLTQLLSGTMTNRILREARAQQEEVEAEEHVLPAVVRHTAVRGYEAIFQPSWLKPYVVQHNIHTTTPTYTPPHTYTHIHTLTPHTQSPPLCA